MQSQKFLMVVGNMDMKIRVLERGEWEFFARVVSEAYRIKDREMLKKIFEINLQVQEDGCLAAFLQGEPVGAGCFFIYGNLAWIGYMGVIPKYQRRGIATSILKRILNELTERDVKTIRLDASAAGYPLYRKFGFVEEYPTTIYEIPRIKSMRTCENVSMVKSVDEEIRAMDLKAFGADRIRALTAWINKGAKILKTQGGYALLKMDNIGPVIAEDDYVAQCLIQRAFSLGYRKIIIPEGNKRAVKLISSIGGIAVHRITRMSLGEHHIEKLDKIYAILDFAKG